MRVERGAGEMLSKLSSVLRPCLRRQSMVVYVCKSIREIEALSLGPPGQ